MAWKMREQRRAPVGDREAKPLSQPGGGLFVAPLICAAHGRAPRRRIDVGTRVSVHIRVGDRGPPGQDVRPDLGRRPRRHHRSQAELAAEGYGVRGKGRPSYVRGACETFITTGLIVVGGEIRTHAYVDIQSIVRDVVDEIGYNRAKFGFDAETCGVDVAVHEQSADIAQGVDE